MTPEKVNSIVGMVLSLVPFIVVGLWLAYRLTKSQNSHKNRKAGTKRTVEVAGKRYVVQKVPRMLVVEKNSGGEAIVTTCGFENAAEQAIGKDKRLPKLVKVRYRLENGMFAAEESDWLPGEGFDFVEVIQVEEFEDA